jgi:N6-adenosine-specific RNA methylase IME4
MPKFNCIVADPPYGFKDKLTMSDVKRGSESNYPPLTDNEIKSLRVSKLVADDAVLALWIPSSQLRLGLDIMENWGFRQTQTIIWVKMHNEPFKEIIKTIKKAVKSDDLDLVKIFDELDLNVLTKFNMGRWFRQSHELALLGIRGNVYPKRENNSQRSVIFARPWSSKNSSKPEMLQKRLEMTLPLNKKNKHLEIFARRVRPGWTCIGDECKPTLKEDIRDSIENLLKDV